MLLIKNLILGILVIGTASLKNPCRVHSPIEFYPHPDSIHSYIQCTKRGEMFAKECTDNSVWNDEKKKCGEPIKNSQLKTLANTYKLKTLLASKPLTEQLNASEQQKRDQSHLPEIESMNLANEQRGQRVIDQIQEVQRANELLQLEKQNRMQMEVIRQGQAQVNRDMVQNMIDKEEHTDRQIFQLNKQTEELNALIKQGHESIEQMKDQQKIMENQSSLREKFATQSDIVKKKNFWSKVPSTNGPSQTPELFEESTTTTTISPRDQMLLEMQIKQQNQMAAEQKFREEIMIKQQEMTNKFMIKQRRLQEEAIAKQQRELEQKQMEHQNMQLNNMIARQRKEREMCSQVTCPAEYRCVLNEEDTLICLRTLKE